MKRKTDSSMTVLEHLSELRKRFIISAGAFLAASIISFTRIDLVRRFITAPLGDFKLIYLSPPEALTANLRLAFVAGAALASPLLIWQLAAFLSPAFTRREKRFFFFIVFGICFLFAAGVVFAYSVVFPFTLHFFLQFASADLEPRFTISEYISFALSLHIAFGLVFQLPLLSWALGRMGVVSAKFLRRNRKYAILVMLVIAAIITPPDVISQIIMVVPLLLLYEIGVIMVVISERKRAEGLAPGNREVGLELKS